MLHAFVASIVGIDKPGREFRWKRSNGEAVILGCYIAAFRAMQKARLILTPMSEFQLIGISTCGKRQQLMAQANAQRGNLVLQSCANGLDCFLSHFRITWAIGHREAIKDKAISWRKEIPIPWYRDYSYVP